MEDKFNPFLVFGPKKKSLDDRKKNLMKKIPLCIPSIGSEELKAIEEVLNSGWLTHGPKTTEFENIFILNILSC